MDPKLVQPPWVRIDLRVMEMKGYPTLLISTKLESYQMQFSAIHSKTIIGVVLLLFRGIQSTYVKADHIIEYAIILEKKLYYKGQILRGNNAEIFIKWMPPCISVRIFQKVKCFINLISKSKFQQVQKTSNMSKNN